MPPGRVSLTTRFITSASSCSTIRSTPRLDLPPPPLSFISPPFISSSSSSSSSSSFFEILRIFESIGTPLISQCRYSRRNEFLVIPGRSSNDSVARKNEIFVELNLDSNRLELNTNLALFFTHLCIDCFIINFGIILFR